MTGGNYSISMDVFGLVWDLTMTITISISSLSLLYLFPFFSFTLPFSSLSELEPPNRGGHRFFGVRGTKLAQGPAESRAETPHHNNTGTQLCHLT